MDYREFMHEAIAEAYAGDEQQAESLLGEDSRELFPEPAGGARHEGCWSVVGHSPASSSFADTSARPYTSSTRSLFRSEGMPSSQIAAASQMENDPIVDMMAAGTGPTLPTSATPAVVAHAVGDLAREAHLVGGHYEALGVLYLYDAVGVVAVQVREQHRIDV